MGRNLDAEKALERSIALFEEIMAHTEVSNVSIRLSPTALALSETSTAIWERYQRGAAPARTFPSR
jgi:hypothetical protein